MTITEAVTSFEQKYSVRPIWSEIWSVTSDPTYGVIHVHTTNAKIWVDLPAHHEGFQVKMNVGRKPRPVSTK